MMAGQYNEIIQIYSSTEVENDYGERTVEKTYVMTTRAKVEETSGTRQNENNEIVYNHNKTFYVRSYVPVQDTSILFFQDHYYRVIAIDKRREHNDIKVATELINE